MIINENNKQCAECGREYIIRVSYQADGTPSYAPLCVRCYKDRNGEAMPAWLLSEIKTIEKQFRRDMHNRKGIIFVYIKGDDEIEPGYICEDSIPSAMPENTDAIVWFSEVMGEPAPYSWSDDKELIIEAHSTGHQFSKLGKLSKEILGLDIRSAAQARTVVFLFTQGYKQNEIAEKLELSDARISQILKRTLNTIRENFH